MSRTADGRTPNYRRRRTLAAFCAVVIVVIGVGVPVALLAPVPAAVAQVASTPTQTTAAADPTLPGFGSAAVGAVGMKGVLVTSGSQKARPIASITKVITALVVLQKKPIDSSEAGPTIHFTTADEEILQDVLAQDGSSEPVQAGWTMTERQTMETMLIPSANNYAESLAVWAYGSVPKYLTAARAFLKAQGMTSTKVVDTNGLGSGDVSTPTDLVQLGRLALASPTVAAIVRMESATEPNVGLIENTNDLLGTGGIDGIKTGTTTPAGACLLFTAPEKVDGRTVQLVGVILNATTHEELDPAVVPLLTSVAKGLHVVPLTTRGHVYGTYRTEWGATAKAIATKDTSTLVWSKQKVTTASTISAVAGGAKGASVGQVEVSVAGKRTTVPLVLDRAVKSAPVWWRLTHPIR